MLEIKDLPSSMDSFKESIELVIITEKLANANYFYIINETDFDYKFRADGMPVVRIPKNVSVSTPPMVDFFDSELKWLSITKKEEMLNKLKEIGMLAVSSPSTLNTVWSFVFTRFDTFYDFYVIWNEYGLFRKINY